MVSFSMNTATKKEDRPRDLSPFLYLVSSVSLRKAEEKGEKNMLNLIIAAR